MPFATLFPLLFSACNSIVSFIYEQFEPFSPSVWEIGASVFFASCSSNAF